MDMLLATPADSHLASRSCQGFIVLMLLAQMIYLLQPSYQYLQPLGGC
jgi:hypothetical protein